MASQNLGDINALERSIRLAARLSVITGYTCVEGLGYTCQNLCLFHLSPLYATASILAEKFILIHQANI